ncbi:unnamed protein product [Moneuplotes crassus]|uniref:Uncharacterized protein n=1 Tax=Euplotes crassus TaxID=5936 RepID=A0AAD1Y7V6_EUPCR|nr:unnamed protein product [Moneuplotes crassus]
MDLLKRANRKNTEKVNIGGWGEEIGRVMNEVKAKKLFKNDRKILKGKAGKESGNGVIGAKVWNLGINCGWSSN